MLALLLNETVVLWTLVAGAVATPPAAWLVLGRWGGGARRRPIILAGAFGPFALALWGVHNLVLSVVGFDSIYSPMILAVLVATVGVLAGRWSAGPSG